MINLKNKVILVTGASSGIGREIAILASSFGASVIITGRNKSALNTTHSTMNNDSEKHCIIPFDLYEYEKFNELLTMISKFSKKIDGVVHCAGISIIEPLRFLNAESVDKVVDLNIKSTIHLIAGLRKKRMFNKNASIVLLSSLAALLAEKGMAAYSASKGAIISLTKSFAAELVLPDKIRVNCLAPGIVQTPLIEKNFKGLSPESTESLLKKYPLGFGNPRDVANSALFFLSDASSWITGSCLSIDGGRSLDLG